MQDLYDALSVSENISVHPASESDFRDWDDYLSKFYSSMTGKIKNNHIFSCTINNFNPEGTQLVMKLRKSDRDCDKEIDHFAIKRRFEGRHEFKSLKDAVAHRPNVMRKVSQAMLHPPGINPYKKVELNEKYKEFVPLDLQDDVLYQPPTEKEKKIVKEEKGERGNLKKNKK